MFYKVSTLGLSDVLTLFLTTDVSDQGTEQPRKLTYFLSESMKHGVSWVALVNRKKQAPWHGKGTANHIVKSGYCWKRTPYQTIWRKGKWKYRSFGISRIWLMIHMYVLFASGKMNRNCNKNRNITMASQM